MKILWIPHAQLRQGRTRSDHLIERLRHNHEVSVVSVKHYEHRHAWRYLRDVFTHRSRRGPLYDEIALLRVPKFSKVNNIFLNYIVQRELRRHNYDVVVAAVAPYATGYLKFHQVQRHAAVVCDVFDGGDWTNPKAHYEYERLYVRSSDAAFCASLLLTQQSMELNPNSFYLPNGVDLKRYRSFLAETSPRQCKIQLGLDPESFVVSIIGMTCSSRLYFVDAVIELAQRGHNVVLLLVGESDLIPLIKRRARNWDHVIRIVGPVPYSDVLPYFVATDLGLKPVDDHPYYHRQSPLKIFEYGAVGKSVLVAPRLDEVARMNLPHVSFCNADAVSVAREIARAIYERPTHIDLDLRRYDWDELVLELERILEGAARTRAAWRRHVISK